MNKERHEAPGPQVLRRGLRVLRVLREAGGDAMHVVDIASAAGMQRSTVYRYLDVLVEEGYVLREGRAPPWRVAELGVLMAGDLHADAVRRLRPAMRQISDVSGDASFLVCRAGGDSLCLHRELGNYPVQVLTVTIGHRQPLGVGAAGLALLAALPDAEAREVIAQNEATLRAYAVGMAANAAVWLLWPTRLVRNGVPTGLHDATDSAWRLLHWLDSNINCFPSAHITAPIVAVTGYCAQHPQARRWAWPFAIALMPSVVATGQHYAWDILGGAVTAALGLWLVRRDLHA